LGAKASIIKATRAHAPFLARTILAASRSHLPRGPFDFALDLPDTELLTVIERMTLGDLVCNCHFTRFLIAEITGAPVGALAAFDPGDDGLPPMSAALLDACSALGHSRQKLATVAARIEVLERCFPHAAPGTWTIEWVAVNESRRRHGICGQLTEAILAEGAGRGCREAQISTYIGNDAAAAAYARSGFVAVREHRSVDLEDMLGAPGLWVMHRDLP